LTEIPYLKKYTPCILRRLALTFFSDASSFSAILLRSRFAIDKHGHRTIELAGHFSLDRKGYLHNDHP
jgi:hypothetical protein